MQQSIFKASQVILRISSQEICNIIRGGECHTVLEICDLGDVSNIEIYLRMDEMEKDKLHFIKRYLEEKEKSNL